MPAELQRVVHPDSAAVPEAGLRQAPHRLLLPPLPDGGQDRIAREATLGPRAHHLQVCWD